MLTFPSVQLFVDRAQTARPDFQVTKRNAAAVAELCRRLEGIPLAIELAAARAQALSPAQMLERLAQRFDLLTKHRTRKTDRHRSLWAALEWSYSLLSPELQRLFANLSVFRGGWTIEAAENVSVGVWEYGSMGETTPTRPHVRTSTLPNAVLDYLAQLRSHSLVLVVEGVPDVRYRLLETLREFAAEQLRSDERERLARRHFRYYLSLAEAAEPQLTGAEQGVYLERLDADHDNLRTALAWAVQHDPADGLRLAKTLVTFWEVRGYYAEGREWLEQLLPRNADAAPSARTDGLIALSRVIANQGDYGRAAALIAESLHLSRQHGYKNGIAQSFYHGGRLSFYQGKYVEARVALEETLTMQRELGDKKGIASTLHTLGLVAHHRGDLPTARAFAAESLALWKELGNQRSVAAALLCLGVIMGTQGEYDEANHLFEEVLGIYQALRDRAGIANVQQGMGRIAVWRGDYGRARPLLEESLNLRRELGEKRGIASTLTTLGQLSCAEGHYGQARTFLEESLTIQRTLKEEREMAITLCILGDAIRAAGDPAAARAFLEEGVELFRKCTMMGVSWGLEGLAKVACAQGQAERATRLFAAADVVRQAIGVVLPFYLKNERDQHLAALRQTLGESAFSAAWNAGRALTYEQAAAEALEE